MIVTDKETPAVCEPLLEVSEGPLGGLRRAVEGCRGLTKPRGWHGVSGHLLVSSTELVSAPRTAQLKATVLGGA